LKNGVTDEFGNKFEGYTFLGNAEEIFDYFHEHQDVIGDDFELDGTDVFGSLLADAHGGKDHPKPEKPKDIVLTLKVTLEEFYNGSCRSVYYTRDQIYPNGRTINKVNEEVKVEIKPGYDEKTVLTLHGLGNEQFGHKRGNLVIKLD